MLEVELLLNQKNDQSQSSMEQLEGLSADADFLKQKPMKETQSDKVASKVKPS